MSLPEEFLNLTNENFISVCKYLLDPNNPAEIVTDFRIDYTHGRKIVAAMDVDDFITMPPHLYRNTHEEIGKIPQVKPNFEEILDLAEKGAESKSGNYKSFDPFVESLVSCKIKESQLDFACYKGAKRTPIVSGIRKINKEATSFGYEPVLGSMSLDLSVNYFGALNFGSIDFFASDTIFTNGILTWINMCSGEMKNQKMRMYLVQRGYSDIFNFRGSDDKIWDNLWADGDLDWFAWSDKSLGRRTLDLADLLKYKGIISVNCPPVSSDTFPFKRVLFSLPRAVVFSSIVNPDTRVEINERVEIIENVVRNFDDSSKSNAKEDSERFIRYLYSIKPLMGPLFVEIRSGLSRTLPHLRAADTPEQMKKLVEIIWIKMKNHHPEFNLSEDQVVEMKRIRDEYAKFRNFGWGFFPYSFARLKT